MKMKKKLFVLPLLLLPMLEVGSTTQSYTPRVPYPGIPDDPGGGGGGGGGEDPDIPDEFNMEVRFYLSYSNSDEPLYVMDWYSLVPLGTCPDQAKLTDAQAPDPLYPVFLGYSEYPSSIDEEHLWNFETDYKQSNILSLYGIWVSNS